MVTIGQLATINSNGPTVPNKIGMKFNYIGALLLYCASLVAYYGGEKYITLLSDPEAREFYERFLVYGLHHKETDSNQFKTYNITSLDRTVPSSQYFKEKMPEIMRLTMTSAEAPKLADLFMHLQTIQKEIEEIASNYKNQGYRIIHD